MSQTILKEFAIEISVLAVKAIRELHGIDKAADGSETALNKLGAASKKMAADIQPAARKAANATRDVAKAMAPMAKAAVDATTTAARAINRQAEAYRDLRKAAREARKAQEDASKAPAPANPKAWPAGAPASGGKPAAHGKLADTAVKAGLIMGTLYEAGNILGAPLIAASDAEDQMTQIGIKADLSREQVEKLNKEIEDLAPTIRASTSEVRGGVDFLAASGLDPRAALTMMQPIGVAAKAYKAEITDLAQSANAALTNFKIDLGPGDINRAKETARVLDIMAVAGKRGNFEFADMAKSFPGLTARMSSLGAKGTPAVAELASALEVAYKATGNADQAANNVDNLLLKLNSKETVTNFKKMGVDLPAALKKAYAEGKGPLEAIALLTQKATGGDMNKLPLLFADAQAQTGVLALIQNLKEFQSIRDQTLNQATIGQAGRDFAIVSETTASRWDKLKSDWSVFLQKAGGFFQFATNAAIAGADALISESATEKNVNESVKLGLDMAGGLAKGLISGKPKVQAAASSLAATMPAQVRGDLQVHSPSRVFMGIGGDTADGLIIGIMRSLPAIRAAAQQVADSTIARDMMSGKPLFAPLPTPATSPLPSAVLRGGATNINSGNSTVNVTVQGGSTPAATGRAVAGAVKSTRGPMLGAAG